MIARVRRRPRTGSTGSAPRGPFNKLKRILACSSPTVTALALLAVAVVTVLQYRTPITPASASYSGQAPGGVNNQNSELPNSMNKDEDLTIKVQNESQQISQQTNQQAQGNQANQRSNKQVGAVWDFDWDSLMQQFHPETLVSFYLNAREEEHFFHEITEEDMEKAKGIEKEAAEKKKSADQKSTEGVKSSGSTGNPLLIRGAFFAAYESSETPIDYQILDPDGEVLGHKQNTAEALFKVEPTKAGVYTFVVHNSQMMGKTMITFLFGVGQETDKRITDIDEQLTSLERLLDEAQRQSTFLWVRQNFHLKTIEDLHNKTFGFCVLQMIVMAVMGCVQVYYIKGLIKNRRFTLVL